MPNGSQSVHRVISSRDTTIAKISRELSRAECDLLLHNDSSITVARRWHFVAFVPTIPFVVVCLLFLGIGLWMILWMFANWDSMANEGEGLVLNVLGMGCFIVITLVFPGMLLGHIVRRFLALHTKLTVGPECWMVRKSLLGMPLWRRELTMPVCMYYSLRNMRGIWGYSIRITGANGKRAVVVPDFVAFGSERAAHKKAANMSARLLRLVVEHTDDRNRDSPAP